MVVEPWPLSEFDQDDRAGILRRDPEYQRRPVWNAKTRMLLVDSVARGVPAGAITLYKVQTKSYAQYEVIDGKQRLTTLFDFLNDKLVVEANQVRSDDEVSQMGLKLAKPLWGKKFSELSQPIKLRLRQYRFPVFVVSGPRWAAVQAFTRMNRNPYALRPQEVRNAMFMGTNFLQTSIRIAIGLKVDKSPQPSTYFRRLGIVSRDGWDRMQDVQLVSELLLLILEKGAQERRDELDAAYQRYGRRSGADTKKLRLAEKRLTHICQQIAQIFLGKSLRTYNFPSNAENDFYALVGAFDHRGLLSKVQMDASRSHLTRALAEFRRQAALRTIAIRDGKNVGKEHTSPIVDAYATTFLGGQMNSKKRRDARIQVWVQVINDVVKQIEAHGFSPLQRDLIWLASKGKRCGRCNKVVEWHEYQAGHKDSKAAGGPSLVTNGRVEHKRCNQSAGARMSTK